MRTTPEKKEEKERVRLALLRATLQLAAAHSFGSLGLREVAREAGIAPTSFYRHFTDMGELGRALIDEVVGALFQEIETRINEAEAAGQEVAYALLDSAFAAVDRDPELVRFVLTEQAGAFASFRQNLRTRLDALAQTLANTAGSKTSLQLAKAAIFVVLDCMNRALDLNKDDAEGRAALVDDVLGNLRLHLTNNALGSSHE